MSAFHEKDFCSKSRRKRTQQRSVLSVHEHLSTFSTQDLSKKTFVRSAQISSGSALAYKGPALQHQYTLLALVLTQSAQHSVF